VVPGTGGYDTIILLVNNDQEMMSTIKKFLEKWSKEKGSNIKLLGTRGELEGARKEDASKYRELVK
jgi:phosphomevalonate kinase